MIQILVYILSLSALLTEGTLAPPERPYKILMLLPISSKSHRNVFMPLANGLIDRGHEVTMLSNHPLDHPKIKHYQHDVKRFDTDNMNMFEIGRDPTKMFKYFETAFPLIAKEMYDDNIVKELYARRKEFDLIVINHMFNNIMYPFAHELKFITIATSGLDPAHSAKIGNFLNPAYVSNVLDNYKQPFSFIDKVKNIFFTIMSHRMFKNAINTPTQIEVSKRFPDLPPLLEIEANQSLSLLNHHFSLGKAVPLLPTQVEVGGMHCRPAKPLPKDIETFLSGNTPVVYMSLGSVARSDSMPNEYQDIIKTTFSKLPFKVLWKYEDENVKGLPKNVMIKKWMPQQDVLAHPNVKVFITHCGGLGTQEAMYHATPMVGLPIFGDQPKNGKGFEYAGFGRVITWEKLSVDTLSEAITDVVTNPEYHKQISRVSAAFRDQLEDPTERAVYWTEYVIRHNGAHHLRSPESDLTWFQLLHLDIILAVHLALYLVYKFIMRILALFSKKSKPQKGRKSKSD